MASKCKAHITGNGSPSESVAMISADSVPRSLHIYVQSVVARFAPVVTDERCSAIDTVLLSRSIAHGVGDALGVRAHPLV